MTATIRQSTTTPYSRVLGVGGVRGERAVPNEEIVGPINSSDEWIRQRTGIVTRRRSGPEVDVIDLAEGAARKALEHAGVEASQLDVVILSTVTYFRQTPAGATQVADRIGATPAAAYDTSAACAGYTYGIAQADALIRAGAARYALVVGAEKLSDIVSPTDRSISFLLGDGAGAAVIGPSETPGVSATVWGSDGSRAGAVGMSSTLLDFRDGVSGWPHIRQEGPSVFRWAVWEMAKVARQALEVAGIQASDLAAFIPHQANMRIIDEFASQLALPPSVVIARDVATTGNTSAASIPLATHRLLAEHPELSGGLALQIGFGAGLAYAAQVVVLP